MLPSNNQAKSEAALDQFIRYNQTDCELQVEQSNEGPYLVFKKTISGEQKNPDWMMNFANSMKSLGIIVKDRREKNLLSARMRACAQEIGVEAPAIDSLKTHDDLTMEMLRAMSVLTDWWYDHVPEGNWNGSTIQVVEEGSQQTLKICSAEESNDPAWAQRLLKFFEEHRGAYHDTEFTQSIHAFLTQIPAQPQAAAIEKPLPPVEPEPIAEVAAAPVAPPPPAWHSQLVYAGGELHAERSVQEMLFRCVNPELKLSSIQMSEASQLRGRSKYHPRVKLVPAGLCVQFPAEFCRVGLHDDLLKFLLEEKVLSTARCPRVGIYESAGSVNYTQELIIDKRFYPRLCELFHLNALVPTTPPIEGEENAQTTLMQQLYQDDRALLDCQVQHLRAATDGNVRTAGTLSVSLYAIDPRYAERLEEFHEIKDQEFLQSHSGLADLELETALAKDRTVRTPELELPLPFIQFGPLGMEIWLPDGLADPNRQVMDGVSSVLENIFGVSAVPIDEYNEAHRKRYIKMYQVPRDQISQFLNRLGMGNPVQILLGAEIKMSYLEDLTNNVVKGQKRMHKYKPERSKFPHLSVQTSIERLVPNEEDVFVSVKPMRSGALEITIPKCEDALSKQFRQNLTTFLGYPKSDLSTGERIITVPRDLVNHFLGQRLQLAEPNGAVTIKQELFDYEAYKTYAVVPRETEQGKLDLAATLASSLLTFAPWWKTMKDTDPAQQLSNVLWQFAPLVQITDQGIDIDIMTGLNDNLIDVKPGKKMMFGEFLRTTLGVHGDEYYTNAKGLKAPSHFFIPKADVRALLEDKLLMVDLPPKYQAPGIMRFYNLFDPTHPHASLRKEGIKVKNASVIQPTNCPPLTPESIHATMDAVLGSHPRKQEWLNAITNMSKAAEEAPDNAHIQRTIRDGLRAVFARLNDPSCPAAAKAEALESIGAGCGPNICTPGKAMKINFAYTKLVRPDTDPIAYEIRQAVADRKGEQIAAIVLNAGPAGSHVHRVARFYLEYHEECGLDKKIGEADAFVNQYGGGVTAAHRDEFIQWYNTHCDDIVESVSGVLNGDYNEDGSAVVLVDQLREKFTSIFDRRNLKEEERVEALLSVLSSKEERLTTLCEQAGLDDDDSLALMEQLRAWEDPVQKQQGIDRLREILIAQYGNAQVEARLKELVPERLHISAQREQIRKILLSLPNPMSLDEINKQILPGFVSDEKHLREDAFAVLFHGLNLKRKLELLDHLDSYMASDSTMMDQAIMGLRSHKLNEQMAGRHLIIDGLQNTAHRWVTEHLHGLKLGSSPKDNRRMAQYVADVLVTGSPSEKEEAMQDLREALRKVQYGDIEGLIKLILHDVDLRISKENLERVNKLCDAVVEARADVQDLLPKSDISVVTLTNKGVEDLMIETGLLHP